MAFKNKKATTSTESDTTTSTDTTIEYRPNLAIKLIGFCMIAGLGYLMLLNVQPWMDVADIAAKGIKIIPFQDVLVSIPFLGGLILFCIVNLAKILGIALWGIVNGLESLPFVIESMYVKEKIPKWILKDLKLYRLIAYCVEVVVCFVAYPPYSGGWAAIVSDWPNFDMNLIDWNNVVTFVLAILGFEICLQVAQRIWLIMHTVKKLKTA